MAKIFPGLW